MRAAIYARISDARDGDTAGVDRQQLACEKLISQHRWTMAGRYVDNNVSAAMRGGRRPAFEELLDDVRAGRVDVVVAWATDRLYRQLRDLERLVEELAGVEVVTVVSGRYDLSTADGRLLARIAGSVGQHESEQRGERVRAAAAQRASLGRFGGGKRRFGYTPSCRALMPEEAAGLRWAYDHIAAGGSVKAAAREFATRGLCGTEGGRISDRVLREFLLRPLYAGLAVYKGQVIGQSQAPPIVDRDQYERVRAILCDPSRRSIDGQPPPSLLTGLLRCGVCGRPMISAKHLNTGRGIAPIPVYRCRQGHASRARAPLDAAVGDLVGQHVAASAVEQQAGEITTRATKADDADSLRTKLDDLAKLLAGGDLNATDYARATAAIRCRLAALDFEELAATGRRPTKWSSPEEVMNAWRSADPDSKRAVLHDLVDHITVGPGARGKFYMGNVSVTWRAAGCGSVGMQDSTKRPGRAGGDPDSRI